MSPQLPKLGDLASKPSACRPRIVHALPANADHPRVGVIQLPDEKPVIVCILHGDAPASITERPTAHSAVSGVRSQDVGRVINGIKEVDGACSF